MSNVAFNNFTSGIVTPKLAGNYGSSIYHNGCSKLENFSIMLQGGVTRRPPLRFHSMAHSGADTVRRLIPFTIDVDHSYIVGLGNGHFRMWRYDNTTKALVAVAFNPGATEFWQVCPWPASAVGVIQYAQSADTLYLVHPDYRPQKITILPVDEFSETRTYAVGEMCSHDGSYFKCVNAVTTAGPWDMLDWDLWGLYFTCTNVNATLTKYTDADGNEGVTYDPMNEDEGGTGNGDIFKTAGNYPSTVAFLNNRLWFANSDNHHIRYWASMPFDHDRFWYYKMVRVVNQTYSQNYINGYITATEYSDSEKYAVDDYCLHNGKLYKCTTAITSPEAWDSTHWAEEQTSESVQIRETVTEDCGIRFDASGNDAVCWISAKNNILVGTASGEYAIPGAANGINYQLSDLSSFGSQKGIQPAQANGEILYVQCGGRKLRSITASSDGYANLDLTYQCDRILAEHGGVVRMAWRRVPDPTLYVVLGDGTMAVLFYERGYGLCGWAHWVFPNSDDGSVLAKVKDVCVIDTAEGQFVHILVERNDVGILQYLPEIDAADGMSVDYCDIYRTSNNGPDIRVPYTSEMVSNPYEYNGGNGSSLGKRKRIRAFTCRVYKTKALEAGYGPKYMKGFTGSEGFNDIEILLPGGYEQFVQMTVRSVDDKPLTLLAFTIDVEGER